MHQGFGEEHQRFPIPAVVPSFARNLGDLLSAVSALSACSAVNNLREAAAPACCRPPRYGNIIAWGSARIARAEAASHRRRAQKVGHEHLRLLPRMRA